MATVRIKDSGPRPASGMVGSVATSPEQLEAMLEDAFIVKDAVAVAELFEEGGLFLDGCGSTEVRGRAGIAGAIASFWDEWMYVAGSDRVFQVDDLAVGIGRSVTVLRRRPDGVWRFAMAVLRNEEKENDHE